jgi:hypothetical protein
MILSSAQLPLTSWNTYFKMAGPLTQKFNIKSWQIANG